MRFYSVILARDDEYSTYIELTALITKKQQDSGRFSFNSPVIETLFFGNGGAMKLEKVSGEKRELLLSHNLEKLNKYIEENKEIKKFLS